jgi:hypothetical protein
MFTEKIDLEISNIEKELRSLRNRKKLLDKQKIEEERIKIDELIEKFETPHLYFKEFGYDFNADELKEVDYSNLTHGLSVNFNYRCIIKYYEYHNKIYSISKSEKPYNKENISCIENCIENYKIKEEFAINLFNEKYPNLNVTLLKNIYNSFNNDMIHFSEFIYPNDINIYVLLGDSPNFKWCLKSEFNN